MIWVSHNGEAQPSDHLESYLFLDGECAIIPAVQPKSTIQRFRRFHGYDYSRGAVLFITFGLKDRKPIFGRVEEDKVIHSPVGLAALETLQLEMLRNSDLTVRSFVIMPDHVHLRIHIRPGAVQPLKAVGQFINNFKRWSKWKASKLGVTIEWQENYHDASVFRRKSLIWWISISATIR